MAIDCAWAGVGRSGVAIGGRFRITGKTNDQSKTLARVVSSIDQGSGGGWGMV